MDGDRVKRKLSKAQLIQWANALACEEVDADLVLLGGGTTTPGRWCCCYNLTLEVGEELPDEQKPALDLL